MVTLNDFPKALTDAAIYVGDNGRSMCTDCAGFTALTTGTDLSGHPVSRVSVEEVAEWATYGLGDMKCECGKVTLSLLAGPDGWPLPKGAVL